ncbi:MAG: GntG family PLP-dependent aldolase [Acidimicrobiia bacterium]|nr:GntG family PLP-dependent aldolase [Acidimicrobiia bacterium]
MSFADGTADFRSDTVTQPTEKMRAAMASALVGDDVYGEDPTVNALEERVAELLGKEAALFTPSGTMANQIAIGAQTQPGDEVICVERAHVRNYEHGGASANFGVAFRAVPGRTGVMRVDEIRTAAVGSEYGLPRTSLLWWENTHNVSGGTVVPLDVMQAGSAVAHDMGLVVHLDGARLWNAAAASGVEAADFAACVDSVMFCFSKGLGAPVGSVVAGTVDFIAAARDIRARLGGAMRQVGVLAAAARVALEERERVFEDHETAKQLAKGLATRLPEAVDASAAVTNMVLVNENGLPWPAAKFMEALAADGVLTTFIEPGVIRFCTHRNVDQADVDRVLGVTDTLL